MKCPICNGTTRVAQTVENTPSYTKRKLKCLSCGKYFFTIEKFEAFTKNKDDKELKETIQTQLQMNEISNNLSKTESNDILNSIRDF